ncbi:MAG TPA: endospore germination permease [Clostridia bacterium]|nr:endospore germination permease [Clostridia bacterium]
MRIDSSQISKNRFMFSLACFLQSSALLTSFVAGVTEQDSWFAVLISLVIVIPLIYLYRTIMVMFPGKNYIQVLEDVFGLVLGKIFGIAYAWFFITLASLNLLDLGDFTKVTVLRDTPQIVLSVMCILVGALAVRNGLKVVVRYSSVFTIIEFAIVGFSILLLLGQLNFQNFLPVFDMPAVKYVQGAHIITTIPFGELVTFLMITPNVKLSRRDATKYWFLGAGMGILTIVVVLLRDIAVLGNTMHLFALPGLMTMRLVFIGDALSRIEIIFAVALIMLLFFKITFLCYVSTIAIAQLFRTTRFKHLALVVGAFILAYMPTLFSSSVEHAVTGQEAVPFIWTPFEVLIPLTVFIVAKVRKLPTAVNSVKEQEA